jgi:hypothetical protein
MSWIYEQKTGRMIREGSGVIAAGYSGAGSGKNNPSEENVQNEGPIPEGFYDIQPPFDSPIHGPYAMRLLPDAGTHLFGRSAFMVHGDSVERPGKASEGCIVIARFARKMMWDSGDHRLQVVKQIPTKV